MYTLNHSKTIFTRKVEEFELLLQEVNYEEIPEIVNGKRLLNLIKQSEAHKDCRHHNESLYSHLQDAAMLTFEYALEHNFCTRENWLYFVLGYMHDIGKVGVHRLMFEKAKKFTTKGHALCGAAALESWILNHSFRKTFNLSDHDCEIITVVTNYHMCAHFSVEDMVRNINCLTKSLQGDYLNALQALRYGDGMGKQPPQIVDNNVFLECPVQSVFKPNNMGLLINVAGLSGSGKTTLCKEIISFLQNNYGLSLNKDIFWINRDEIIHQVVANYYSAATPRDSYDYYKKNKSILASKVNNIMRNMIKNVLVAGERICLVDSLALMFLKSRSDILNAVPFNGSHVSIDVWTHRYPNSSYTEEESQNRLGISLEEQLNINGFSTNAMDVIGSNVKWTGLHCLLERDSGQKDFNISSKRSLYSIPIGHDRQIMRKHFFSLLTNLMNERNIMFSCTSLPPLPNHDEDMDLSSLIKRLIQKDASLERLKRFFKTHNYTTNLNAIKQGVYLFCVKYIDKINKLMCTKWAREARGAGFVIDTSQNIVLKTKYSLDRCVEVLTAQHNENGITESQDMKTIHDISFLNKEQQEVVKIFNNRDQLHKPLEPSKWFLTAKVDGCLLVTSIYKRGSLVYQYLKEAIANGTYNPWHVFINDILIIPATSGSLEIGDTMKSTLITALAGNEKDELRASSSPNDLWEYKFKYKFSSVMLQFENLDQDHVTIVMEMVCQNRTTYNGYTHREIATSYNYSGLFLLGLYIGQPKKYVPSYKLTSYLSDFKGVLIPETFLLSRPSEAINKMKEIEDILITSNCNLSSVGHPEGFILTRHDSYSDDVIVSCKFKLSLYYKAHSVPSIVTKFFKNDQHKSLDTTESRLKKVLLQREQDTLKYFTDLALEHDTSAVFDIFPETDLSAFTPTGLTMTVTNFCKYVDSNIVSSIMTNQMTDMDYNNFPATIYNDMKNAGMDDKAKSRFCKYLFARCEQEPFKNSVINNFKHFFFVNDNVTDDEIFREARCTLQACFTANMKGVVRYFLYKMIKI